MAATNIYLAPGSGELALSTTDAAGQHAACDMTCALRSVGGLGGLFPNAGAPRYSTAVPPIDLNRRRNYYLY